MTDIELNPRWANYCRFHGRSSDQQLEHDRVAWPGGKMTGFLLWHKERITDAWRAIPSAFQHGAIVDHPTYDAWLESWVDNALLAKRKDELWDVCQRFITDQRITCPETIAQVDRVIENAYDFIEEICDVVGYLPAEDDDE